MTSAGGLRIDAAGLGYRAGSLKILDEVNLSVLPGEFVGVLGPSGCGKSTLLRCLSGQLEPSAGKVLIDSREISGAGPELHSQIGFVPQDDIVHAGLKVERALLYSARLRMPADPKAQEQAVNEVLQQLDLGDRRRLRIDRLSGGQRKRVSIGVELLTRPRLLFLDEPTSGLDPALEEQFMELCRRQSRLGRTVVLTTHILQSLDRMDQLILMGRGRLAFFGAPDQVLQHFGLRELGEVYKLLAGEDPAALAERFAASAYFQSNVVRRLESAGLV